MNEAFDKFIAGLMSEIFEKLIAKFWNWLTKPRSRRREHGLDLGLRIVDGQVTAQHALIRHEKRTEHLAVLGKTGTGKSSFLLHLCAQDIAAGRGFVFFDLHGFATEFLLRLIAAEEQRSGQDLGDKLILIEPSDTEFSVGLNFLEQHPPSFVRIAEYEQVLRERWHLDHFGARTDELLRNSLYVLADNGLTLVELSPFLTNATLRATCFRKVTNDEVKLYFEARYSQASEAMQRVMNEPILNKVSAFTADPRFRHIVGQANSTFSILDAMDEGRWVLLNLDKGQLGEQAITLGSLLLLAIKNALFSRKRRQLFTVYCDEVQNLVQYNGGLETILSEARKFGVSVVSANQYLDQYSAEMRAAVLSIGTHAFFQLSSPDAQQIATALDGGRSLAERLKNLPRRRLIVKSGHERWQDVQVPILARPKVDATALRERSRTRWTRARAAVDQQIAKRLEAIYRTPSEAIHDWE